MSASFSPPGFEPILSRRFFVKEGYTYQVFCKDGGYEGLRVALSKTPAEVIELVKQSQLRGRGGAGFPTGSKWSFVPKESKLPKAVVINADESEPGTYKDRYVLARDPHLLLEGAAIAAYAIGANHVYIYVRGEYGLPYRRLHAALQEAYSNGIFGSSVLGSGYPITCVLHRGAGAYICGEETALLESLEGKIGRPRLKPPFPAMVGAFGGPTVVNNVETLACVAVLFQRGVDAFLAQGSDKNGGPKLICVSGHVERPGVYEVPNGYPCSALIELCGGVWQQRGLKAVIPGGSSTPILAPVPCKVLAKEGTSAELWPLETDVPLDFDSLRKVGSMFGSAGMMVLDDQTCIVRSLATLARFYAHESCGQCTPCREGTGWAAKLCSKLEQGKGTLEDIALLKETADNMAGATICPLADALAMPVTSYLQKFEHEFVAHVEQGCCPLPAYEVAPANMRVWEDQGP